MVIHGATTSSPLYKRSTSSNTSYADAVSWGKAFLDATSSPCSSGTIESSWESVMNSNPLPSDTLTKDFIIRGYPNESGDDLNHALARYDSIMRNHPSLNDYVGRRGTSYLSSLSLPSSDDQHIDVFIISALAFMVLLSASLYIHIRLKKVEE